MKRYIQPLLLALVLLVCPLLAKAQAQVFGNEWINYDQSYWKITVMDEGIYRLSYQQLQNAGFPVASIDPRRIQLFFRGQEIAVNVSGQQDGRFDPQDFIEFYGRRNRGNLSGSLFEKPEHFTSPYMDLYEFFRAHYFITVHPTQTGKRWAVLAEQDNALPLESSHTQVIEDFSGTAYLGLGGLFPTSQVNSSNLGALLSDFNEGKGPLMPNARPSANTVNRTYALQDIVPARGSQGAVRVQMRFAGRINTPHDVDVFAGISTAEQQRFGPVARSRFINYQVVDIAGTVDTMRLPVPNGNFLVGYRVNRVVADNEEVSWGFMRLEYPQGFDMQQAGTRRLWLQARSAGRSRIRLTNAPANLRLLDISDELNVRQVAADIQGATHTAVIDRTATRRTLLADNRVLGVSAIARTNFRLPAVREADYLIITHPNLMQAAGGVPNAAQAYADYRASAAGGGYRPLMVSIFDLFDQFTYGEIHPLAFRRFADYALRLGQPKFLLLLGKGIQMSLNHYSEFANPTNTAQWISVPSWGAPSSDMGLTAGLNGQPTDVPAIPTGRIAANTPQQVINYLNKVREYEADNYAEPWRKRFLHLSGGFSTSENTIFRVFVNGFKDIAEADFIGANVETISKRTTDFVEFINVSEQINRGVGMVTFYGHAALDFTDIDIGRVSDTRLGYNNKGKYPVMLINGCGSGDAFQYQTSLGEDWILTPDRGAIAFLAHSHLGFAGPLRTYTETFYQNAFANRELVNKPIGVIMQTFLRDYTSKFTGELHKANAQQFILQGDPAIQMFKQNKADYSISERSLFAQTFAGRNVVTAQTDSFRIGIPITNLGLTNPTAITVAIRRTYSDLTDEWLPVRSYPAIRYLDTVYYTVPNPRNNPERLIGQNMFEVYVDYEGRIEEMREDNNVATLSLNILRGSMIALAPKEFSIVSRQPVLFIAQNTDPFARVRSYRFQLDTAFRFNSPARRDTVITAYLTPQWNTRLLADNTAHDSTVYYWRVRFADPQPNEDTAWVESSFVYIRNSPDGWSQSRTPQFRKNTLNRLSLDLSRRKWNFEDVVLNISARTTGGSSPTWNSYQLTVNGTTIAAPNNCSTDQPSRWCDRRSTIDRLLIVTIDGETGQFYRFEDLSLDACGASLVVAAFDQCMTFRTNIVADYINRVKPGDYVFMMNARNVGVDLWTEPVNAALRAIGVNSADFRTRAMAGGPFLVLGRKGSPVGSAVTSYANPAQGTPSLQTIALNHTIRIPANAGTANSTLIGPAAEWGNMFRLINNAEQPVRENWRLDVLGVDLQGTERVIRSNVRADNFPLADVSAQQFPYLRLRLNVNDSINRTPYQLQRWQVIYKEVPEGILFFDTLTYRENTVLEVIEGDTVKIGFNFVNISGNDFRDSLWVEYTITNLPTGRITRAREKLRPLARNGILYFRTGLFSPNFRGENRISVFVNPRLQAEQVYENNTLEARFRVKPDDINPVLDVAVDGRQIMDGDIVSPAPLINITLRDENRYLPKRDTTGFEIILARQCPTCTPRRIYLNNPNLAWNFTTDGRFLIEYRSATLENGLYILSVQGQDATGNKSGPQPYRVSFQVVNETTVTNFYPYPNPFTSSMRFVFTLTGELPEDVRIQIMTVAGTVVRTIHKDELGALRIGNNVSEFAWDGTDQYGDPLARGVYLYKVDVRRRGGEYFQLRESAADAMFKNGYGKIYLMR